MTCILYFIVSIALIALSQELACRGGTPCSEWEDVQLIEPKKKEKNRKKSHKEKKVHLYLVAPGHESEIRNFDTIDPKWA